MGGKLNIDTQYIKLLGSSIKKLWGKKRGGVD